MLLQSWEYEYRCNTESSKQNIVGALSRILQEWLHHYRAMPSAEEGFSHRSREMRLHKMRGTGQQSTAHTNGLSLSAIPDAGAAKFGTAGMTLAVRSASCGASLLIAKRSTPCPHRVRQTIKQDTPAAHRFALAAQYWQLALLAIIVCNSDVCRSRSTLLYEDLPTSRCGFQDQVIATSLGEAESIQAIRRVRPIETPLKLIGP